MDEELVETDRSPGDGKGRLKNGSKIFSCRIISYQMNGKKRKRTSDDTLQIYVQTQTVIWKFHLKNYNAILHRDYN